VADFKRLPSLYGFIRGRWVVRRLSEDNQIVIWISHGEFAATVGIDFRAPFDRQSSFDRVVKHLGVCNFNIKLGVTDHSRLMSRWLEEAKTRPITTKDHECGAQTWPHNIYCEPEVVAVKGNGTV